MNIDVHGHVVVEEILRTPENDEPWRPIVTRQPSGWQMVSNDWFTNGPVPREIVDWPRIIETLDATKVDMMAVSPAPFCIFNYLDAPTALEACQIQNDAIANAVQTYPDRLIGMGIVPLQNVALAIDELQRIAEELEFPSIELLSNVEGTYLGHEKFWPFWEAVEDLDLFVFVHPTNQIGKERLNEYYLTNLIGNPIETTRSVADIVFSGLLEAHPNLKICFAHAGGTVPFIRGRWDRGYNARHEPRAKINNPPNEYVKLLYFDTVTHWEPALAFMVETMGADHVVMGSDHPFDMGPEEPARFVEQASGISEKDKEMILTENAARLLKLEV